MDDDVDGLAREFQSDPSTSRDGSNRTSSGTQLQYHIFIVRRTRITIDKGKYKDGIHLLIPDIWLNRTFRRYIVAQFRRLISRVLTIEGAESLVDSNSANVSTHLFGSCKTGGVMYELAHAVRIEVPNGETENVCIPLPLLSLRDSSLTAPIEEGGIPINLTYELSLTQYVESMHGRNFGFTSAPRLFRKSVRRVLKGPFLTFTPKWRPKLLRVVLKANLSS